MPRQYVRVTSYRREPEPPPPPQPLGYCPNCTSPVTTADLRTIGFVCGHCGTVAPRDRIASTPTRAAPPPPRKSEPPVNPERQEWTDLLASWLIVYDRTKPWRMRRRREAWKRMRHWQRLLGARPDRRGPYADAFIACTFIVAAVAWTAHLGGLM